MILKFKVTKYVEMWGVMTNSSFLLNELRFNIFERGSCINSSSLKKKKEGKAKADVVKSNKTLESQSKAR